VFAACRLGRRVPGGARARLCARQGVGVAHAGPPDDADSGGRCLGRRLDRRAECDRCAPEPLGRPRAIVRAAAHGQVHGVSDWRPGGR
jgi:hypothetical protein